MWALSVAIFVGVKWLSWLSVTWTAPVPMWRKLAYWTAWPGLNARGFVVGAPERVTANRWLIAGLLTALGATLLLGLAPKLVGEAPDLVVAWVGMLGIIFLLHFGALALVSCFWNSVGIQATPLMQQPLASTSVSEFWSARWNTAFRDLTSLTIFRPLTKKLGAARAAFAVFLFSGIVHDVVISVPARGGYGKPTLYFLIQWLAIAIQRSGWGRSTGIQGGMRGWLFTMLTLGLPLGLLFHPEFATRVILPFVEALKSQLN